MATAFSIIGGINHTVNSGLEMYQCNLNDCIEEKDNAPFPYYLVQPYDTHPTKC